MPDRSTVLDRGPGIPETDLTKVFDRFHRADTARAMPGSGLGLAIVRDVVERMDGTVRAENRSGGGLSIGFDVPTVSPSAAQSPADRSPASAAQSPAAQSPAAQSPASSHRWWRDRPRSTRCSSPHRWGPPRRPLRPRHRRPGCEIVRRGVNRRAVVVGAGPNGLVAAITLARAGWDVTVYEAAARPGGGTRSEELTVPGVIHDVCSAIHPLAVGSPAFREIAAAGALSAHGLEWIHSEVPLAHPLDGGRAAVLHRSVDDTATALGRRCAGVPTVVRPARRRRLRAHRRAPLAVDRSAEASAHDGSLRRASGSFRRTRSPSTASPPTRRRGCSPASPATRSSPSRRRSPPATG